MTRRGRRLAVIGTIGCVLAGSLALSLSAMRDTIVFFRSPSEIAAKPTPVGTRLRLGGLVETGSVTRSTGQVVEFKIGDGNAVVPVRYRGLLPDLFREGQGIVAEGAFASPGLFVADTVLARHDESYMPREVADALKAQGRWQESGPKAAGSRQIAPRQASNP